MADQNPKTLKLNTAVASLLKITIWFRNGYFNYKWYYENLSRAKDEVNKIAFAL
jgi:hypothetical protein